MLNVGIIGLGVGERHAEVYEADSRCNLAGAYDFDILKLNNLKTKFPNVKIYNSDLEIFDDEKIDLVSIASYDNYHAEQILNAIDKNKHVMVEKPICLSKKELDQIIEAKSKRKNLKLSSNLVLRSDHRMIDLKNDIKMSRLGDIYYLEADYFWGRINKLNGWRSKMDYYSIVLGAAVHMIDLIIWIFDSKPISVYALGNKIGSKSTKLKFNSFAVMLLKFSNDLIVKITGNGPCVHPHFHGITIFGSKKTIVQNFSESYSLKRSKSSINKEAIKNQNSHNKNKVITNFIDSILDPNLVPIVNQKDIYDVMSICFAAEESIKKRQAVKILY
tara:strand:+ start:810 stop:1802 length:993 start_codon:yes stop_codon:yes gene_type:complete